MKKNYFLIILLAIILNCNAQSSTCAASNSFCAGASTFSYPNATNAPNAESGIDYGCLITTPNSGWFNLQAATVGDLTFNISQVSSDGTPIDVDYIVWGPFSVPSCGTQSLNASSAVACSYAVDAVENFTIHNNLPGQYYKLLVSNFSNVAGTISITQTNYGMPGSSANSCAFICPISLGPDYAKCAGTMDYLTANISVNNCTFQWYSSISGLLPQTTQTIAITEAATYTVVASSPSCQGNPTDSVTVTYVPAESHPANDLNLCTGSNIVDLYAAIPEIFGLIDPNMYDIRFFHSFEDAQNIANPVTNGSAYAGTDEEILYYAVEDLLTGCYDVGYFHLNLTAEPSFALTTADQTLTIDATGADFYSIDGGAWVTSNIFTNVPLGEHMAAAINDCGTTAAVFSIDTPDAPFGASPQYFNSGDTLGDLEMNGQNIQWYADGSAGRMSEATFDTPLSLTTVLATETTYYATQTINNVESPNRFPVLTLLSSLGNPDFVFSGWVCYPNPVKNVLTFSNSNTIYSIALCNVLGQKVFSKNVHGLSAEINVAHLSKGIYFAKIASGGQQKTIRIIKE
jgi:hypothetical protein